MESSNESPTSIHSSSIQTSNPWRLRSLTILRTMTLSFDAWDTKIHGADFMKLVIGYPVLASPCEFTRQYHSSEVESMRGLWFDRGPEYSLVWRLARAERHQRHPKWPSPPRFPLRDRLLQEVDVTMRGLTPPTSTDPTDLQSPEIA